jgi:hypothetical protein
MMEFPAPGAIELVRAESPDQGPLYLQLLRPEDRNLLCGFEGADPVHEGLIPFETRWLIRLVSHGAVLGLPVVIRSDLPVRHLTGEPS